MLSSTVVAVFIALAYVIGSNGSDNTINSRFDTFSDRTNGLDDRTNGLGEQTSQLGGRTNELGEQTSQLDDRTNGLGEQTSRLSDLTDEHVLFQVTNQPDTEPAAKASMPNMGSANEYGVKERCERYTMKNQGLEREYYLYRPEGLKAGAPLVIVLHGYGGSALKGKKAMMDVADKNGFAVCYPQGIKDPKGKPGWNVRYPSQEGMKTDDVKFLIALSKELQKRFDLSPKNTFLTGMSNGGDIIYLIAMRAPKAFKAMASIAGLQFNWMETEYSYKHPLPFMEVHGTQDHTSEWLGDPENKGGWGAYIPVPAAVSRIIAVNGCTEEYVTELPRRDGRYQVTLYQFTGGKPAAKGGRPTEVWLYKVEGGDHSWSDKDMDTCSEIWRFFSQWID